MEDLRPEIEGNNKLAQDWERQDPTGRLARAAEIIIKTGNYALDCEARLEGAKREDSSKRERGNLMLYYI